MKVLKITTNSGNFCDHIVPLTIVKWVADPMLRITTPWGCHALLHHHATGALSSRVHHQIMGIKVPHEHKEPQKLSQEGIKICWKDCWTWWHAHRELHHSHSQNHVDSTACHGVLKANVHMHKLCTKTSSNQLQDSDIPPFPISSVSMSPVSGSYLSGGFLEDPRSSVGVTLITSA